MSVIYYIACPQTELVKIGFTSGNPYLRMKALQTGSASQLLFMACHPGTQQTERQIHEKFASQRIRGEWFEMGEELFEHISFAVWAAARKAQQDNSPVPDWVRVGLYSMHNEHPLPDDLAALI